MFDGKEIRFSQEKNAALKKERGVSFDEVVFRFYNNDFLDIIDHKPSASHGHQKLAIVEINGYAHVVPYVESGNEIFLKTIYPSREMTKRYLGERG